MILPFKLALGSRDTAFAGHDVLTVAMFDSIFASLNYRRYQSRKLQTQQQREAGLLAARAKAVKN